jgi:hypothetical protein
METVSDKTISKSNSTQTTKKLLMCGIVAGVLSPVVVTLQIFTREGFDVNRHPLSMLSLGDFGWIQIANFIITGLFFIAYSIGLSRHLDKAIGGTWVPRLIGIYGVILIAAGIFTVDPMDGFPPGTPDGLPATLSWHAQVHNITFLIAFLSLIVAQFIFARRFASIKQWGWSVFCILMAVATPALIVLANMTPAMFGMILFMTGIVTDIWVVLVAIRLVNEHNQIEAINS